VTVKELSPREQEVYALLTDGFTPSEAAVKLGVAPSIVSACATRIKAKLGVQTVGSSGTRPRDFYRKVDQIAVRRGLISKMGRAVGTPNRSAVITALVDEEIARELAAARVFQKSAYGRLR
jgi:DNA-binding NarL/FixJ family response regulator